MRKQTPNDYAATLREIGPVAWAESEHGFIMEDGEPIELTPWQRAFLESYEAHREAVSTLAISNIKKTGKTALNAVLTAWRWLALPGQHFCAGNDLDQSQARQFGMIADMLRRNPYLRDKVRAGKSELVFLPTGSKLTALASDATGNAGANFLTTSHTETWGILYENGVRGWEELTPPPGRWYGLPCLRIADSYAGYEGESKTWHTLVDRGLKGERISKEWPIYLTGELMLFHAEGEWARENCFRGTPEEAESYYREQQASLRPNAFTRLHANQRTTGEGSFVNPEEWDACYSPDVRPLGPGFQEKKAVFGADASTTRDLTALVGCVYDPISKLSEVVYTRVWRPKKDPGRGGKPTIDLSGIKGEIERLQLLGQVEAVYFDPFQLHSISMDLRKAGVRMIELPQNSGRIESDQLLYDSIISRSIHHYGDPTLTEHVRNAVAQETPRGFRLAKERTSLKIDAAVALSMANYGSRKIQRLQRKATTIPR